LTDYKEILAEENIKVWMKWGSLFESTSPLIKAKYIFDGTIDPKTLLFLLREERINWDKAYIEFKEAKKISNEVSLMHYVMKPPMFLMKARDFVEKTIRFEYNGIFYLYSSSVPNEVFAEIDQYQRCETIFGGSILTKEGDKYAYYSFSQIKVSVCVIVDWKCPKRLDYLLSLRYLQNLLFESKERIREEGTERCN